MKHETQYLTGAGGVSLYAQRWLPGGEPKAKLLLIHGYAEHSGRYATLAEFLTGKGYAVYAYDHRGHGHSPGKRAYIDRFSLLLKDLTAGLDWVREDGDDKPLFLFGQSMGGAVVTLYCLSRNPDLRGVILSGAMLKVSEDLAPFLRKFSSVIGGLLPRLPTIKFVPEFLSRDSKAVQAYIHDPLNYNGRVIARTGAEMLQAAGELEGQLRRFDYPVLILHGEEDKITEPEASQMLFQQAASRDKTFKTYPGAYHELLHELNKEEVMADILAWMEARLAHTAEPETP